MFVLKKITDRFLRSKRANIATITAILAVPIFGAIGLAIDYTLLSQQKSALQDAADSAAIATAQELMLANSDDEALKNLAQTYIYSNLQDVASTAKTKIQTAIAADRRQITVEVAHYWEPFLLHYAGKGVLPIKVNASASIAGTGTVCMIGLAAKKQTGIGLRKKASLAANKCGVYSNSAHKKSIVVSNDAVLKSGLTCSAGGVFAQKRSALTPQAVTNCPQIKDPLADRTPPPIGRCTHNQFLVSSGTHILTPGRYCGGLKVQGKAKAILNPGIYVITGGLLQVTDDAEIKGENVGFYLADDKSQLAFAKRTTIDLVAPKDGPMAGLLIFEQRDAKGFDKHRITSDNARMLLGTIYLPGGTLRIDSDAPVADKSAYTAIIAESIELDEGPTLHLNSDYEATDVPVPEGLVGKINLVD